MQSMVKIVITLALTCACIYGQVTVSDTAPGTSQAAAAPSAIQKVLVWPSGRVAPIALTPAVQFSPFTQTPTLPGRLATLRDVRLTGIFDRTSTFYGATHANDFWRTETAIQATSTRKSLGTHSWEWLPGTGNTALDPSILGAQVLIVDFHSRTRLTALLRRIL
jgi:hypothetical protein